MTNPELEHLDVMIVGAGISGIAAGHHIKTTCPWASFAIFEAREKMGGTWDLFKYPGIRSDSDMFTLGFSFRPWDGEQAIADGAEILRYLKETATAEGLDEKIRYQHKIVNASWSSDDALWHVTAQRGDTGETVQLTTNFLFACSGYYRYDSGYLPDFQGIKDFEGDVIHPQFWPEDFDFTDKKVVVIGSGATAITLVPSLSPKAGHVTMLQRSPTYMVTLPKVDPIANFLRKVLPTKVSGGLMRWQRALFTQGFYRLSRSQPEFMRRVLRKGVAAQLPKDYDTDTHFNPHYKPWDQRVCMVTDGDMFREIRQGRASVVTDHIETFDKTGIKLASGDHLDADVVITATGLSLLFLGGIEIEVDGQKVEPANKLSYKGMMLEDVPNLAIALGYTNASWTLKAELTCDAVARTLNHMRRVGMRQATPVDVVGNSATSDSVFDLQSGYVQRAASLLPKQGKVFPWQVHQSYVKDYIAMKKKPIVDGVMQFTNPSPLRGKTQTKSEATDSALDERSLATSSD